MKEREQIFIAGVVDRFFDFNRKTVSWCSTIHGLAPFTD